MSQLFISEGSVPDHIKTWLASGTPTVVIVAAKEATPIVRQCVTMAREFEIKDFEFYYPDVEQQLLIQPVFAAVA